MLVFCDSFDHYTTVTDKWDLASGGTISIGSFGRSVAGISLATGIIRKNVPNAATYIMGFYCTFHSTSTGNYNEMAQFLDSGTCQTSIGFDSSGHVLAKRNASTTIGTSSGTISISAGSSHYIEFLCTVDDSAGAVTVKVDGATLLTVTGADTKQTSNAYANQVQLGPVVQFQTIYVDDFYVCDTSGTVNNTFLGDVSIKCIYGNAAGFSTGLTAGGTLSGSNYGQTDESSPNGDTDYVENATVTARDSYGFADITLTGSILGLQLLGYCKKDDAGSRSIALCARSNAVDSIGSTQALTQSYVYYRQIFETDPNTTALWAVAGLNAAEFGMQIAA